MFGCFMKSLHRPVVKENQVSIKIAGIHNALHATPQMGAIQHVA
jgi:Na+-transporting NADH:ubiquinone oxidoreductase subunit NqrD